MKEIRIEVNEWMNEWMNERENGNENMNITFLIIFILNEMKKITIHRDMKQEPLNLSSSAPISTTLSSKSSLKVRRSTINNQQSTLIH
jgi:hypothetical protein